MLQILLAEDSDTNVMLVQKALEAHRVPHDLHVTECADTPVFVVSSSDAPRDRARMAALGIAYYFRKPLDLDAFMILGAVGLNVVSEKLA